MKSSVNNSLNKQLLPRSRILRGKEAFQHLFEKGVMIRGKYMDLRYLLFPDQPDTCLMGFVAGKRLGKAHQRNAIKRRMREIYRQHQSLVKEPSLTLKTGFHGIFIAKKIQVSYSLLEKDGIFLLSSIRFRKKPSTDLKKILHETFTDHPG